MPTSIFLEFSLPNSTTWFYFSVILATALFFKFRRFFSLRNWDLLALFAMVPGLLLVQEGRAIRATPLQINLAGSLQLVPDAESLPTAVAGAANVATALLHRDITSKGRIWWGYAALLAASAYWLLRCVVDLALVRRPAMVPNLNPSGLAFLACALFVSLGIVAVTKPVTPQLAVGSPNEVLRVAETQATNLVGKTSGIDRAQVQWMVERAISGSCHLLVVVGLVLVGKRHFGDIVVGVAAATAYLLLPYIAFHITKVDHVLPGALLVWAVASYQKPRLAGALVGIAGGGFIFPLLVAPVWIHFYKRRGMGKFLLAFAIAASISLAVAALVLWFNDRFTVQLPTAFGLPDLKKWRVPEAEGFWTGVHWAYRIPVFLASIAFVIITAFWPEPKNLGHVLALSSAHLLAAQLWFARNGGAYVLWYLPLLLLVVFRPNLSDCVPRLNTDLDMKKET